MRTEAMVLVGPAQVEVTEIDVPAPGPGEVLIEVKANGICRGDIALFTGELNYGYPFFQGHEPAGVVAQVGPGVTGLTRGDKVCHDEENKTMPDARLKTGANSVLSRAKEMRGS